MALKTKKAISLTGESKIGDAVVMNFNANVTSESAGYTNVNQTILDNKLYKENIKECRADVSAFNEMVWAIEDEMIAEVVNTSTETVE